MKGLVSQENLSYALTHWSPLVSKYDGFPFFGTLLGLVRQGCPIEGDDDVDFLIPIKHRDEIIALVDSSDWEISPTSEVPDCLDILQIRKYQENELLTVDFYFFHDFNRGNILLKWHFIDARFREYNQIKIKKTLVYPLILTRFDSSQIFVAAKQVKLAKFLYGPKFRVPQKKNSDYVICIRWHRPRAVKLSRNRILRIFNQVLNSSPLFFLELLKSSFKKFE